MQRALHTAVAVACLTGLTMACFGPVLWRDRQFTGRDAGEYYYPLHQRVQQEWREGRWPLWEPEENGGMPLLGNPSAAVLYPGKLVFAALPYAWAARAYTVSHVLLAVASMVVLLRSWRVSGTGSALGGIAYGFGGPVLFQHCNVIYLVGAAWAPLGLLAVDRLVRLRRPGALPGLAAVLALQVLGGDPEAAYLVVACGVVYALGLACAGIGSAIPARLRPGKLLVGLGLVAALAAWVGTTLASATWLKANRERLPAVGPGWSRVMLLAGWAFAFAWLWSRRRRHPAAGRLAGSAAGLIASSALALGLAGAQVLPGLEFAASSTRQAEGGPHAIYPFSVEPVRAVEWAWPNVFGPHDRPEAGWLHLVPPSHAIRPWVPSLYLGGLTFILALGAAGFRDGPPWRAWLTAVAIGSALGAIGEYGSPVWWAREVPAWREALGDHDPPPDAAPRDDDGVSDGDGGVYWLLAASLPGFSSFRYPGKLLVFTSLALAALAGIGWDRWSEGGRRRGGRRLALAVLVVSLSGLIATLIFHDRLVRHFDAAGSHHPFAPFGGIDAPGAVAALRLALLRGAVVMACALGLAFAAASGWRRAAPSALILLSADLALANAGLVVTAPQADFDRKPKLARLIEEAEARDPATGPFRVHRMPPWYPSALFRGGKPDALVVERWERDTLKPKAGVPHHLSYTLTPGALELAGYASFFGAFPIPLDASRVPLRGVLGGRPVLYYTRRGYDLWNTRYFLLPMDPGNWQDVARGFVAFLPDRRMIAPDPKLLEDPGAGGRSAADDWIRDEDWQLLRNEAAYPRAWVVHRARFSKPIRDESSDDHAQMMRELLFANDPVWHDPGFRVYDPREFAWVEADDPRPLAPFVRGGRPGPDESVSVSLYEPQRVELDVRLDRPGLVVLADVHYPGWSLTIDGRPAPIHRVNRLMRGAGVAAGSHRLVYTYDPLSFRAGGAISVLSLAAVLGLVYRSRAGPRTDRRPWARPTYREPSRKEA